MNARGATLLELLVAVAVAAVLAALLLPAVVRAQQWCKAWAYGTFAWQENRINCFLDERASEATMLSFATNRPRHWSFITQTN